MTPTNDPDWLKQARSKGGKARAKKLGKKGLSVAGRKAALARWQRTKRGTP